jgi:anti-sigma regulatory factor (Ser/Thr protein kinase)
VTVFGPRPLVGGRDSGRFSTTSVHEGFDHVAVFHDGPDDLGAQLSECLPAGVAATDAVLLCLDGPSAEAVAPLFAGHSGTVQTLTAEVRYQRPTGAMRMVHDFTREAMAAGATRVWSIGRIDFGGDDDGRWARYEAAVDDVLSQLPLVGVCAYDTGTLDDAVLDIARVTHRHVQEAQRLGPSTRYGPAGFASPATWWIPASSPTVELTAAAHGAARRAAAELAVAAGCPSERVMDLELVTSELVANAVVHGAEPASVRLWRTPDRIVVQTLDHGPGLTDRWPDLRPPTIGIIGGLGLWLVGQLADRFHIGRHDDGITRVTAAIELP